jgi:hypothetical protein
MSHVKILQKLVCRSTLCQMFFTTNDCVVCYLVIGVTTTPLWNSLTLSFYDHWLRSCRQLRCYFIFGIVWRVVQSSSLYYLELKEYNLIIFTLFITYKVFKEKLVPLHTTKSCVVRSVMVSHICNQVLVNGRLHSRCPLHRRPGGSQSRSGIFFFFFEKRNVLCPCWESDRDFSVVQPVA